MNITTTSSETFTLRDSQQMAAMILRRFGYEQAAAAAAWRRLLGNSCPDEDFMALANEGLRLVREARGA